MLAHSVEVAGRLSESPFVEFTPEKSHSGWHGNDGIENMFEAGDASGADPTHPVAGKLKGSWCVKVVAGMGVCRNVSDGVICWTEKGL